MASVDSQWQRWRRRQQQHIRKLICFRKFTQLITFAAGNTMCYSHTHSHRLSGGACSTSIPERAFRPINMGYIVTLLVHHKSPECVSIRRPFDFLYMPIWIGAEGGCAVAMRSVARGAATHDAIVKYYIRHEFPLYFTAIITANFVCVRLPQMEDCD